MEFKLNINLDNDAYQDLGYELRKNVEYIASDVGLGLTKGKVRDTNGNTTGHWEIVQDEAEQFIKDHFQFIRVGD